MLTRELVFNNLAIDDFESAIQIMGGKMLELDYVHDTYVDAVIQREKGFPTGLQMERYGIAIPHTDREHVKKSAIAVASLQKPITVKSMIDPTKDVQVQLMILMAVEDPEGQVKMLGKLMGLFQDVETLQRLEAAGCEDEMFDIVSTMDLNSR